MAMKKKTKKIFYNKKAQVIAQGPVYFLVTIILFVALVTFFIISSFQLKTTGVLPEKFSAKSEALITLQSYLATPAEFNIIMDETQKTEQTEKVTMTMADAIRAYCMDKIKYNSLYSKIGSETAIILGHIYPLTLYSSYNIYVKGCDLGINSLEASPFQPSSDYIELPFPVPGKEDVKIQFEIKRI